MSFRKKHKKNREAEEEDMKVAHAKDSKGAKQQAETSHEQAPQQAEQAPQQAEPRAEHAEAQQQSSDEEDEDDSDSEPVPDGTTAEILKWVGDNQDKAQRALDKEQADDKPRPGLTRGLKKIIDSE